MEMIKSNDMYYLSVSDYVDNKGNNAESELLVNIVIGIRFFF